MRNITTTVDELNSLRTALDGTNQLLLKRKEPSADTEVKRQAKVYAHCDLETRKA